MVYQKSGPMKGMQFGEREEGHVLGFLQRTLLSVLQNCWP